MKRIGGLKRKIEKKKKKKKLSHGGLTPVEELQACRQELHEQARIVARLVRGDLRPALTAAGIPILNHTELNKQQRTYMQQYFPTTALTAPYCISCSVRRLTRGCWPSS
jgi:polyphosphate kinase